MRATKDLDLLRWSLVFVWLSTAVVSVWELNGQSQQLLAAARLQNPVTVRTLILGGAAADAVLGLWMLLRPSRNAYAAALAVMLLMTVVATFLLPTLWLHPLGPLSKNLPIAAALWLLLRRTL